jgi:hypothetical protein
MRVSSGLAHGARRRRPLGAGAELRRRSPLALQVGGFKRSRALASGYAPGPAGRPAEPEANEAAAGPRPLAALPPRGYPLGPLAGKSRRVLLPAKPRSMGGTPWAPGLRLELEGGLLLPTPCRRYPGPSRQVGSNFRALRLAGTICILGISLCMSSLA